MAVWEDLLVLPFKVTASRTTTIQQRILCLSYEQIWEICTLRHPKVSIVGQAGEAAQRKNTHNPALAVVLANQGAMEGLSETSTEKTGGAEASKQPQCLVHTEAESRVRGKEKYLNIKKKNIYNKFSANIILDVENLKASSARTGTKQRYSLPQQLSNMMLKGWAFFLW